MAEASGKKISPEYNLKYNRITLYYFWYSINRNDVTIPQWEKLVHE